MQLIKVLVTTCKWVSAAVLIAILSLDMVSVVLRYVFNQGFQWSEEVQVFGLIWIVFLTTGALAYTDQHLSTDLIKKHLTVTIKRLITVFKVLVIWITSCLMIIGGFKIVINSFQISQVSTGSNMPMWLMYSAPAVGYCLASLGYIKVLRDVFNKGSGTSSP